MDSLKKRFLPNTCQNL